MKWSKPIALVVIGVLLSGVVREVHANVYATDIQVNGSLRRAVLVGSNSVSISFILNDVATGGVELDILRGTNVLRTFYSTNGDVGTNVGLNVVTWDGTTNITTNSPTNCANLAPPGVCTVRITASSVGYPAWTNITDDSSNFSVPVPRGIAVNQNTNSRYYGRVFVSTASQNYGYGIYKFNPDGSPGDEGGFSDGGIDWGHVPGYSPWKLAVSEDDGLYVDDFSGAGLVYAFDQVVSPNWVRPAIRADNYPLALDPDPSLSGLAVTGSGTNTKIWMTDDNPTSSAGVMVWAAATNGIAASNDTGIEVVAVDGTNLTVAPFDVAVASNGVFAIQSLTNSGAGDFQLLGYSPCTNGWTTNQFPLNCWWHTGDGDPTMLDSYGVAADPTGTWLAVAVRGTNDIEASPSGSLQLYLATNGAFVTNLDDTGGDAYYDAAWDRVGNLYALDASAGLGVWRAYSPPGPNTNTTTSLALIQIYTNLIPPVLSNPVMDTNGFHFTLLGQSNVAYTIESSPDLMTWTSVCTNVSDRTNRFIFVPGVFTNQFFEAVSVP